MGFRPIGGGGGQARVPNLVSGSPFADLSALETWSQANASELHNSETEYATAQVGTAPDFLTYEWIGPDMSYQANSWSNMNSLTLEQQDTLKHFVFKPETNKLEADRAIETTLNSFFLGDIHKMSSGGENIFFTNLDSDIDYFPMWGGIKDQSIPTNQDASGVITPSARVYSNDLLSLEVYGPAALSGSVPYARASSVVSNQSVHGQQVIVEEPIEPDDYLFFEVYSGTDDTGRMAYEQLLTGQTLSAGDTLTWWFNHPIEGREGTPIYTSMKKASSEDDPRTVLNVRESSVIPGTHYVNVYYRLFEDKDLEYISPFLYRTEMDFSVDETGTTVVLSDPNTGVALINYPVNTIKAIEEDVGIRVVLDDGDKIYINQLDIAQTYVEGVLVTQTLTDAINELNTLFQNSGTTGSQSPVITSSLAVSMVEGQTLNYELTDDYGTEYEWDTSAVSGVVVTSDNRRKIIGGSSLVAGVYNIPVKAINYNGEDSQIIVLTVENPPFANTKSVQFNNNDYLGANAGILDPALGRAGNGSGSSDAWSIVFWFKPGTATNASQTAFYFGSQDVANQGNIQIKYNGSLKRFDIKYGTNNNNLTFATVQNSLTVGQWHHFIVTYDGGTTGSASGSVNSYYSRFKFFLDGANVTSSMIKSNSNFGYSGSVIGQNLRVGRYNNGQSLRNNCKVDELAVFNGDVSALASSIYNGGAVVDLMSLGTQPQHWWRMGDGDSYPFLLDSGFQQNCIFVMSNMTSSDIVNDVP